MRNSGYSGMLVGGFGRLKNAAPPRSRLGWLVIAGEDVLVSMSNVWGVRGNLPRLLKVKHDETSEADSEGQSSVG